jgi:hypothetical protein
MKAKISRHNPCLSRLWYPLTLPAAVVMAATAPGAAAHSVPQQPWKVTGSVVMNIVDYETFGPNEYCNYVIPLTNEGNTGGAPSNYWYFGKCGGEIRAEIHYQIQRSSSGLLDIEGKVDFYEGTSVNTDDLDGTRTFDFQVAPNTSGDKKIKVWNEDEDEPDDRATVTLFLHNT